MKKIIAASLMALTVGATAATAEVKVGLGFGVDAWSSLSGALYGPTTPQATIRVPIDFDFGLRVEPELGFISSTYDDPNWEDTYQGVTFGVGGYYNLWKVDKVNVYAGGRLAYTNGTHDEKQKSTGITTTTDEDMTSLQALFGAEYFFVDNMSFAAQAGLEFITGSDGNNDVTSTGTTTTLVIRYFF